MSPASLHLEQVAGIALLRLDRPPVNAIDLASVREVAGALGEVEARGEARALLLCGAGSAFCAGLDLRVVPSYGLAEQREMIAGVNRAITSLYGLPIPTVAAVHGHAIAGGLVLALACDYRIGTTAPCKVGLTEARAGIPFPAAAIAVVKAELSAAVARRLTLVARNYGPAEALADGVFDELQPPDAVWERARAVAQDLAAIPREAYARIKEQLRAETLASCRRVDQTGRDPLADAWLGAQTSAASAALLGRRRE
jgi:enoyl-CoA hydratase